MSHNFDIILPIESCKSIINSKNVQIRSDGIEQLAKIVYKNLKANKLNFFGWKNFILNPKKTNEFALNWIFLVDALNFGLWHHPKFNSNDKYQITYNGITYEGFQALCAAVNRALDDGYPITEPYYYANITIEELKYILRSDKTIEIPLIEERLRVVRETGCILLEVLGFSREMSKYTWSLVVFAIVKEFQGSFLNCVKLANGSATYLMKLIVDNFPSFKDEVIYMENNKVTFYSKAQLVIRDIFMCFDGRGHGNFFDIDEITVCADYQIAQVLRYYNCITYSEELTKCLISNKLLNIGHEFEVDIRAACLITCRLITDKVVGFIKNDSVFLPDHANYMNDIILNFHLNNYRIENSDEIDYFIPFHKVFCTFY